MNLIDIVGIIGAIVVLTAFLLNQFNRLPNDSFYYDLLNAVGSGLLVAYGLHYETWPFVVLNIVWATVSAKDVVLTFTSKSV